MQEASVNIVQLKDLIKDLMPTGVVPMINGSPGIGKSAMVYQLAEEYNLEPITYTLSNRDSTDITGFPTLNADRTRSSTAPPDYFPIEGDPLPEGKQGWLIFFDEIKDAMRLLQATANQVILDKRVGFKKLHPKTVTIAAGNLTSDNAAAVSMSSATKSRMVHYYLKPDVNVFLDWAVQSGIDHRICSFLRFKNELLYNFDPDNEDDTFAAPRTWEMLSKVMYKWNTVPMDKLPTLIGTIGKGAAYEFKGYLDIIDSLAKIEDIINNPEIVPVPNVPGQLYGVCGLIANNASVKNISKLIIYINKMPKEFQFICMNEIIKKHTELLNCDEMNEWCLHNNKYV